MGFKQMDPRRVPALEQALPQEKHKAKLIKKYRNLISSAFEEYHKRRERRLRGEDKNINLAILWHILTLFQRIAIVIIIIRRVLHSRQSFWKLLLTPVPVRAKFVPIPKTLPRHHHCHHFCYRHHHFHALNGNMLVSLSRAWKLKRGSESKTNFTLLGSFKTLIENSIPRCLSIIFFFHRGSLKFTTIITIITIIIIIIIIITIIVTIIIIIITIIIIRSSASLSPSYLLQQDVSNLVEIQYKLVL